MFVFVYIWLCIHVSIHTDTIHIHILNIDQGSIVRRCVHLHLLHYIYKSKKEEKRKKKKNEEKKTEQKINERIKVIFCKGAYNVRTMQPRWFETVYLREKKKKKERLFLKMEVTCFKKNLQ